MTFAVARSPVVERSPVLMQVGALTKRYRDQAALAGVSFEVRAGEVLGLIGAHASGKTTPLETVAGVLPADTGDILWRGAPLPVGCRRDVIFYLPDGLRPWDDQFVSRVLAFFSAVYERSEEELAETVRAVGLSPILGKRVLALSKGYGRRLMLALALLTPHPLVLLDEPFDGFDLRQTREIMHVLRDVANNGRTLVLAIHQLGDAARVCDRFVLLADGRVRRVGTLAELRAQTGKPAAGLEEVFLALT